MSKTSKKRPSTAVEDENKSKNKKARNGVEDEDVSKNGRKDQTGNKSKEKSKTPKTTPIQRDDSKNKKRKLNRDVSKKSNESSAGSESENIGKIEVSKTPKPSAHTKKHKKHRVVKGKDEKREVEAILSSRVHNGNRAYLIKWKDDDEQTWESSHYVRAICLDLLREFNEKLKNEEMVEAILSHKRDKKHKFKYLIKWKDLSKGETWESLTKVSEYCPKMLRAYTQKLEEAEMKELEVKDILSHKLVHNSSKYLIKWKDKSKENSWETARRTIALCPEILDKFTEKNPDCVPVIRDAPNRCVYGADLLKTTKLIRSSRDLKNENKEWEVKQIENVRINEDGSREFLIKWKGYKAQCNSWEAEENLNCSSLIKIFMSKRTKAKTSLQKEKHGPTGVRSSERHNRKQRVDTDVDAHADTNDND